MAALCPRTATKSGRPDNAVGMYAMAEGLSTSARMRKALGRAAPCLSRKASGVLPKAAGNEEKSTNLQNRRSGEAYFRNAHMVRRARTALQDRRSYRVLGRWQNHGSLCQWQATNGKRRGAV